VRALGCIRASTADQARVASALAPIERRSLMRAGSTGGIWSTLVDSGLSATTTDRASIQAAPAPCEIDLRDAGTACVLEYP
jgi:hypothetical protein